MNRIQYKVGVPEKKLLVYLDGKRVGCIYKVEGGYQYFPGKVKNLGGFIYKTIKGVKADLEHDAS